MKQPVLFINACVRQESRTGRLAKKVLAKLDRPVEEVRLSEIDFPPVDAAFLKLRDRLIAEGNFDDPSFALARQFAQAATVVIAAPYWDLSFPAALKQYFEQINVVGVTFRYTADGRPVGLCRADKLIYVTTAGGTYVPEEFGYGYLEAMAKSFYGISDVRLIKAVGLDIAGADVESILRSVEESIMESNL